MYYLLANPTTALVNIQPSPQNRQQRATLAVVIDHPDAIHHQIAGARLLSSVERYTMMQMATGKGYAQATSASGTVEMIAHVPTYGTATISAGTTLTGSDGITLVADVTVTAGLGHQTVYFPAHVAIPGAYGNMPTYAFHYIDHPGQNYSAEFYNITPFTGGQNAGPYTFVQKNDIIAGEKTLTATAEQSVLSALLMKMSPMEQWVSAPICPSDATASKTPGQRVSAFQVAVVVVCSGEVYNTQEVQAIAAQALFAAEQHESGESYQLSGKITTTITGVQITDQKRGTLAVSLLSSGTWAYHFTEAQKQHLALLIAGESVDTARKLLLQQHILNM